MAYSKIVEKLFELDPEASVISFADMMKKNIIMPAHFMFDGRDQCLFDHYSAVSQQLGIYGAKDYADITEFLIKRWKVESLSGLSEEGEKARDFLCGLAARYWRLEERIQARAKQRRSPVRFSWVYDREVQV